MPAPIVVRRRVDAPASVVWSLITDLTGAPERISGITRVEVLSQSESFGVGTTWRETRKMFGKEADETMTVTAMTDGESYTTEAHNRGTRYESTLTVAPVGPDTCELSMSFDAETSGRVNQILATLLGPVMKRSVIKMINQDLADIARAAEAKK